MNIVQELQFLSNLPLKRHSCKASFAKAMKAEKMQGLLDFRSTSLLSKRRHFGIIKYP
jgi:hypothetical protein